MEGNVILALESIIPVRGQSTTCLQDLIITAAKHYNHGYELAFSEAMKINFINDDQSLIGERIICERKTSLDLLEEYHGIRLKKYELGSSQESLALIREEMDSGKPTIVQFTSYWNPWGNPEAYQKLDVLHFFLVTGISSDQTSLRCIDPVFSKKEEYLPIDHFYHGNNGLVYTIERVIPKSTDYKAVLRRILMNVMDHNHYQTLDQLADAIQQKENIRSEFEVTEEFWSSPLFRGIDILYFGRRHFSNAIKFIIAHATDETFKNSLSELNEISNNLANKWEVVQKVVVSKYFLRKDSVDAGYEIQIPTLIRQNIESELELEKCIKKLIKS